MRVSILRFSVTTSFRLTMLRSQHLLAAEGQKLARERRCAFGGAGDFLRGPAQVRFGPETLQQKFGVSGNHHQQIVEVVRDAARQPADGLHLLRLAQLLFERAPFGDVLGKQLEYDAFLPSIRYRTTGDPNDRGRAVLALPFGIQSFERSWRAQKVREIEPLIGVGVEAVDVLAQSILWRQSIQQFEKCGIGVENFAGGIAAANSIGSIGHQRTKIQL